MTKLNYTVVIEKGPTTFGASVPDLPGCVAVGDTPDEVARLIREAIDFHIEGMREDGLPVPKPSARGAEVAVSQPALGKKSRRKAA